MDQDSIRKALHQLFRTQPLAVLATHDQGQPYANLVAFAAMQDLQLILFATPRATRKYANLTADPRAAMLVDNRSNAEADFQQATAVTATGTTAEVPASEHPYLLDIYLKKHPYLKDFVQSPSCAFMQLAVQRYVMVNHFQEVTELLNP